MVKFSRSKKYALKRAKGGVRRWKRKEGKAKQKNLLYSKKLTIIRGYKTRKIPKKEYSKWHKRGWIEL